MLLTFHKALCTYRPENHPPQHLYFSVLTWACSDCRNTNSRKDMEMLNVKRMTVVALSVVFVLSLVSFAVAQEGKVNINTASAEQLTQLKGIGPALAQRIIEYREKIGPFEKPEDLMKVKGIGQKTFESIKDAIVVE